MPYVFFLCIPDSKSKSNTIFSDYDIKKIKQISCFSIVFSEEKKTD